MDQIPTNQSPANQPPAVDPLVASMDEQPKRGRLLVPIIIIILVTILAGAATWWYMNSQINKQKQQDAATINELNQKVSTLQAELDATKGAPQSTSTTTTDQQEITAQVQAMYKYWIDGKEKDINYLLKNNYITQAVVDQYNTSKSVDLISCSQNTLTKSTDYQYSTPTVSGTTGTMKVSGVYAGPPPSTLVISLNTTKEDNVWKVSKITCPTQ